jgi:uncharacterized phage protein (TIGR01671 family)
MREIKFRIWDKLEQRFIFPDKGYQGHYILDLNGRFHNLQNGSGGDECIVQQYTGLKDKNGKEIYEGDIVKYSRCHVVSVEERKNVFSSKLIEDGDFVGEIIFIFPSFCWSYDHKRYDDIENMTGATHRYEVIGNIFETPELLK